MELTRATEPDLPELLSLYRNTSEAMERDNLSQWRWGVYPREELIREDVAQGLQYILRQDGRLVAAVSLTREEPVYEKVLWSCGLKPGVFHRLAVDPLMRGQGLGSLVIDDLQKILRQQGCDCVRCDTAENNRRALRLYESLGFRRCDTMTWPDDPGKGVYIALDKALKRETPLWPVPMRPAFRGGSLTPWGGDRLRTLFSKKTTEEITGESLEASCIPGLESRDPQGRTLSQMVREQGARLVGRYADRPFPLLLKLIDAKDRLSVQVHPGDAYAFDREDGKLGKTEAWLILRTPEAGGELIYGIRPGTSLKDLRVACEQGGAMEPLLRRVTVQPGDVCYIPAGCVHAIGAGILLYEIQQSSDLTYRFYDWDRVDAEGKRRELHLDKALDVTDLKCAPEPVRPEKRNGVQRVLDETYFTLDVIRTAQAMETPVPPVADFGFLTCLEGRPRLKWQGASLKLRLGETVLLPRSAPPMTLEGRGVTALAMPAQ